MQEEERELRDNYCPEVSEVKESGIEIDKVTSEMLKSIGMEKLPGVFYRRSGRQNARSNLRGRNNNRPQRNAQRPRRQ